MNTCKAALRILHARKLYVIIYLVWIGAMMLGISWQIMHASRNADSTTYQPSAAQVTIIDRDADADGQHPRCVPICRRTAKSSTLRTTMNRYNRPSPRTTSI